jgi:4-alpha-glucanotransferase
VSEEAVRDLARQAGVANDWIDASGRQQRVALEPLQRILAALGSPCSTSGDLEESRQRLHERMVGRALPPLVTATVDEPFRLPVRGFDRDTAAELTFEDGSRAPVMLRAEDGSLIVPPIGRTGYHHLRFADREAALAVAPGHCLTVADVARGEKLWGIAVQLYSLKRAGDGGIGDTTALRAFARSAASHGADAVALSPTSSLFPANPAHFGPYSPSNRLFLNPLYADPSDSLAGIQPAVPRPWLEDAPLIDWVDAARAKYDDLRRAFEAFATRDTAEFDRFVHEGGARLREQALFEAVHAHWSAAPEPKVNWHDWPADWHDPTGDAVSRFAAAHEREIRYHLFLQWLAARSFARAQTDARAAGMRIGMIADLAVGMDAAGSHAWGRPSDLLAGLSIGAPPDSFNMAGQNWGLVGFSPHALIDTGFEPFLATLRASLRYAGGVRIDHAMGLMRLWLIPQGSSATEGAYVSYPLDDMLRLLALESHRHRAIVIGEDLGTVSPEFRGRLHEAGIGGMDVLWFQRHWQDFMAPTAWRPDAVALTTTHDLPTVAGWWSGADLEVRRKLDAVAEHEVADRVRDRGLLWQAFVAEGVASAEMPPPEQTDAAVEAALGFVARSPSSLMLAPVEDLLGLAEQPNLPGTIDEHPNWRRRLPVAADVLLDRPEVVARVEALTRNRK